MSQSDNPEFSYRLKVAHISANPVEVRLEADERERVALARLWNVLEVPLLTAELQVSRWKKDGVKIRGKASARIIQACVATLEPVEEVISETIEAILVPEGSRLARMPQADGGEMVLDPDGPDLPDTFVGDTIDAGLVVMEHVALAIDPFPRKPGVPYVERIESTAEDDKRPSPFAILSQLKKD